MAFSNPIAGGDGELVRDKLRSENYVAGVDGWVIERDGNAEFNAIVVRGDVEITDFLRIFGTPPALIEFGVAGGNPHQDMVASNGDIYRFLTSVIGSDSHLTMGPLNSPNSVLVFVYGEGIALVSDAVGAPSVLFDDDDGFIKRGSYAPWAESGWINVPALQNSWVADTSVPQYRVQPDGTVRFRGWIKNGTTGAVTTLFTMPAGVRPSSDVYFKVAKPNDAGATGPTLDVTTAGVVRLIHIGTSVTASLSLDNIHYSTL
jgi:hypothetical protein